MATDLIASISRIFTPEALANIASSFGVNRGVVQQAVAAGIPSLLAGLAGVTERPGGAQRVVSVLMQQPPGALDDVRSALGGSEQKSFADHGAGILSRLLGNDMANTLSEAIEEYSGLGQGQGKSILGLIVPAMLGVLGQQQRASGIDAGAIASLLAGQKDAIALALPPGLADELSGSGVLDSLGDALPGGAASARVPLSTGSPAAPATGAGASQWVLALAVVAAIGGLLWYLSGAPQHEQLAVQPSPVTPVEGRAVSSPQVSAADLTQRVQTTVDGLKATLEEISDESSAAAMRPKLRETLAEIDSIGALTGNLPAEDRQKIVVLVSGAMPAVNVLCDKVIALPASGPTRPLVETMRAKLRAIAGT